MNIEIRSKTHLDERGSFLASLAPADLFAALALTVLTVGQVAGLVYLCTLHTPRLWEWEVPWFSILEWLKRTWSKQGANQLPILLAGASVLAQVALVGYLGRKTLLFAFKSLGRNQLRTSLTSLAIMVLVFVVTLIWTVLVFLDLITTQRSKEFKAIVTERYQIPSQMPIAYADALRSESMTLPEHLRPRDDDLMTWQFYGANLEPDPAKRTRESMFFCIAMEASKLRTMMDDLENFDPELVKKMEATRSGCIVGRDRLKSMNKQVGEKIKPTSMNYKGIDLEFEIIGVFPEGRYDNSAVMNRDYLLAALDDYKYKNKGIAHPMASKTLNLYWMRLPNEQSYDQMGERVASGRFSSPAVKFEMASSAIGSWLDGYKDLIWGMRWLLSPAILLIMAVVVANAISISVRERRTEMAVLKVLGFGPTRIMGMVLAEALLIGCGSGLLSAGLSYLIVTVIYKGIKFPVAFFPTFTVYLDALWWGLLIGAVTAFLGSILPAWSARRVKVAEVFAKTA